MRFNLVISFLALVILGTATVAGLAAPDPAPGARTALICLPPRLAQDVLESAVLQELLRLRAATGLSRTALPVMLYTFDRREEQEYCRFRLRIRLGYAPCIALVTYKTVQGAAVPDAVLDHVNQVRDWKGACAQMMGECLKRRKPNSPIGLLVVWDHSHAPVDGALEKARKVAHGEAVLKRIASRTVAAARGNATDRPPLRIIEGRERPDLYTRWHIGPGKLPLAGLANLDVSGEPIDLRTRLDNVDGMPEEQAVRLLLESWRASSSP